MGFMSWLTLIFIVLKFTGYIAWSWALVLAPLCGTWGFIILVALIAAAIDWEER